MSIFYDRDRQAFERIAEEQHGAKDLLRALVSLDSGGGSGSEPRYEYSQWNNVRDRIGRSRGLRRSRTDRLGDSSWDRCKEKRPIVNGFC